MYAQVEQRRPHRGFGPDTLPTVAVYGLGYIGLPTAAMLAKSGVQTVGIDRDSHVVELVNEGQADHRTERGLPELVANVVSAGVLHAALAPVPADVHIIAVGTPITSDRTADLSAVEAVTRAVATVLKPGDLVILESTVPPLTCERVVAEILRGITGLDHSSDYLLAHCPERVIPGNLLDEIVHNDRIVGGTTPAATAAAAWLYSLFVSGEIIETDARTAEISKLMENSYRDVNIAFANEMAQLAAAVDVDVSTAIRLANRHPRVHIHEPGIGVGGHCIPIDPWFLVTIDPDRAALLRASREVNDSLPRKVAEAIRRKLDALDTRRVTLLGLSYKRDVDDLRESPAVEVARRLAGDPALAVDIVEPFAVALPPELSTFPNVRLVPLSSIEKSDGPVVRLIPHAVFEEQRSLLPDVLEALDLLRIFNKDTSTARTHEVADTTVISSAQSNGKVSADQF